MNKQYLKESVENVFDTAPLLIVGDAYKLFRKAWKHKVISVRNAEDVREMVEYYTSVNIDYPLVIEDVALLNANAVNLLLKLVEDASYPVILLSSYDNINGILLSRVKTFIKFTNSPIECAFMKPKDALQVVDEKSGSDTKIIERYKAELKFSPLLYYFEMNEARGSNKSKILDILL